MFYRVGQGLWTIFYRPLKAVELLYGFLCLQEQESLLWTKWSCQVLQEKDLKKKQKNPSALTY